METLQIVLLVVQVLVAAALIGFILIQHGKGADAGAAFGSGASSTVFGSQGSGNFLSKTTGVLAFVFLVNSMALAYIANEQVRGGGVGSLMQSRASESVMLQEEPAQTEEVVPVIPEEAELESESDIPAIPE